MIIVYVVVPTGQEDVVTGSDGIKLVADTEVGTKNTLHSSLTTGNGKTEGNRDVVDDIPKRVIVFNGAEKGGTMTTQGLVDRLTIGDVDILHLEGVEQGTDILGGLMCNGSSARHRPIWWDWYSDVVHTQRAG